MEFRNWKKATRSQGTANDCVEVALTPEVIGVRDSKDSAGPFLTVPASDWSSFVSDAKRGTFDR